MPAFSTWMKLTKRFAMTPSGFVVNTQREPSSGVALDFGEQPASALAFSADGKRLAVSGGGMIHGPVGIHVFDVESGERTTVCTYHRMGVHDLAFASDGLLASVSHDYTAVIWNLEARDAICLLAEEWAGAVSRQSTVIAGNRLLVADGMTWVGNRASLHAFDLDTGAHRQWLTLPKKAGIGDLRLAPGMASVVALLASDMREMEPPFDVLRLDLDGREIGRFQFDHAIYHLEAARDGLVVIIGMSYEDDDEGTFAWTIDLQGDAVARRKLGDHIGGSAARSSNGDRVAIGFEDRVEICAVDTLEPLARFSLDSHVVGVAWSPDDRWIAAGTQDGKVQLLDPRTSPWDR